MRIYDKLEKEMLYCTATKSRGELRPPYAQLTHLDLAGNMNRS